MIAAGGRTWWRAKLYKLTAAPTKDEWVEQATGYVSLEWCALKRGLVKFP